jgi:hypothetical protein
MTNVRFGWLGAARRQSIAARLDAVLGPWLADWCTRSALAAPHVQSAAEWPHEANLAAANSFRSLIGECAFHLPHHSKAAFGRWLMDLQEEDGAGVAEALAAEALADLAQRIHAQAGATDVTSMREIEGESAADVFRAWAGAMHAPLQFGRLEVDLLLDRNLCSRLAPVSTVERPALAARGHAIAGAKVPVEATLEFGLASLADLSNLQVGELIVSDTPLSTAADLRSIAGRRMASGQLSRAEGHLALRLQTTHE